MAYGSKTAAACYTDRKRFIRFLCGSAETLLGGDEEMSDERDKAFRGWAKLLNPDELRTNLVRASIFLTAYEFLRQALIEHLEGFFSDGWDVNGPILGEDYRCKVLSLHQMPFFASAIWFRNSGALSDDDLGRLREIREHRNFVAHHIPEILGSVEAEVRPDLLRAIADIVRKIDIWWIREVEIPTNPDLDSTAPDETDLDATFSMRMAVLDLLLQVADGNEETLRQLYEQFTKRGVVH
ncbi:MAG: hypothetical protein H8K10_11700 [Nitrospira sp.]|nr:hypothetical protein [Nitrospira sp.]